MTENENIRNFEDLKNAAKDRVQDAFEKGQDLQRSARDSLSELVQERPLTMLAAALGIGFVVGAFRRR